MNRLIHLLARAISLVAASAVTIGVVLYPRAIATDMHSVPHGWLVCLMIGMSAAYVHGFGFIPKHPILKRFFSPWIAWPMIVIGAVMLLI